MTESGPHAMNLRLPLTSARSVWVSWPEHGLSADEWSYMMHLLETMKPGLIRPDGMDENGMMFESAETEPDELTELIAAANRNESLTLGGHEYIPSAWLDGRSIND